MRIIVAASLVLLACKGRHEASREREIVVQRHDVALDAADHDGPRRIGSPLPEAGPHPDYPTPVAAGTDKIFLLEDPDRGPKAPATYAWPTDLTWKDHAYCEADALMLACSAAAPKPGAGKWMVGRKGKSIVVAHEVAAPGASATRTFVYLARPDGTPLQRIERDAHGQVTEALFHAKAGGRYTGRARDGGNALAGCGAMAYKRDAQQRLGELACLQWLGDPMHDTRGVAITRYGRDARGFIVEETQLDIEGKPIADIDGVHRRRFQRDADGRTLVERYFGVDDAPVASASGCFGSRFERATGGLVTRSTCLGAGDRTAPTVQGNAIAAFRYNARGCQVAMRRLDVDGKAAANHNGVHGRDETVDSFCATTSETCIDGDAQPIACGPGTPARTVSKRDAAGYAISTKHYAADGSPGGDPEYGVFELRMRWDDRGNLIAKSCHDAADKPVECSDAGFHREQATFDDVGRVIEERFFDDRGEATSNLGTVVRRFRYDNYDHMFEATNHDADNEVFESLGMATQRKLYDAAHRQFALVLLDRAGQPARYTGCFTGSHCPAAAWHAVRINRRPDRTVETNQFFDAAGQLIETVNCTKESCFE